MDYNYTSIKQIDNETLDYLNFVSPEPIENMSINEINMFLTRLEKMFKELDNCYSYEYIGSESMDEYIEEIHHE